MGSIHQNPVEIAAVLPPVGVFITLACATTSTDAVTGVAIADEVLACIVATYFSALASDRFEAEIATFPGVVQVGWTTVAITPDGSPPTEIDGDVVLLHVTETAIAEGGPS